MKLLNSDWAVPKRAGLKKNQCGKAREGVPGVFL